MSQSSSEKTEQPTAKKLRDLRKKGQVPKSKEAVSTSLIVVLFFYISFDSENLFNKFSGVLLSVSDLFSLPFEVAIGLILDRLILSAITIIAPFLVIVLAVGILANILQFGVLFSGESLKPDIKKINPIEGAKKIFSRSNFVEFLKSVVKVFTVIVVVWVIIQQSIESFVYAPLCGLDCYVQAFSSVLVRTLVWVCCIFVIVAILDIVFQRADHIKKNKMTKDEVKKDHKESDGDPDIKSKRKKIQRELASGKTDDAVKKATFVVKNPTRYAVAVRYHLKTNPLPIVLAKGENINAKSILMSAEKHNIPIMENVPLAQGLYGTTEVGGYVNVDLIPAVVEVLQWVKENYPQFETAS